MMTKNASWSRQARFCVSRLALLKRKEEAAVIRPRELKELRRMYVRRKWVK